MQPRRLGSRLTVIVNGMTTQAEWRTFADPSDLNGKPLLEQIRVSGLGGDDTLEFISTPSGTMKPLDVSDLTARSNDWIGVLDGAQEMTHSRELPRAIAWMVVSAATLSLLWG